MSSKKAYKKRHDPEPVGDNLQLVREALIKLKSISADTSFPPQSFDLSILLERRPGEREKFSKNLSRWPAPIQDYFKRELVGYVREHNDFKQEDLKNIDGFVESALMELTSCPPGKISQKELNNVMKSVANELRHYYGLPEDYVEFPCWRR